MIRIIEYVYPFMKHLFNHEGMMYFFTGVIVIFISSRLKLFNEWLVFLHTLQHELVHIIVSGLFRGSPVYMEVSTQGGLAYTTKSNFIVRLSPYALPLFSFIILGITFLLATEYRPAALVLAGVFYGNFIRRTVSSLHIQPDIQKSGGKMIAYPVIITVNIAVLAAIGLMVKSL